MMRNIDMSNPRKRGMFGAVNPSDNMQPMGQMAAPQMDMSQRPQGIDEMAAMEAPERKRGFFGQGGAGRAIAGTIGDVLLQRGGMAPIYAPAMQQQQQSQAAMADEQRKRQSSREDWMEKEMWKLQNPGPTAPRFEQDNAGNVWALDPMTGKPMGDKPTFIDPNDKQFIQDGQLVTVPNTFRTAGGAAPAGPPAGAVSMLKQDPSMAQAFDEKYGQGSAARILGGPAAQAPGGFPAGQ